jgi:DNA-directed RNA polymerase specialized sigma24 family protein
MYFTEPKLVIQSTESSSSAVSRFDGQSGAASHLIDRHWDDYSNQLFQSHDVDKQLADSDLTGDPEKDSRVLLRRWRAGDGNARQQLLEINHSLAVNIAKKKARKYKANEEDLIDVALVALVEAAEWLLHCRHDNARGYFAKSIYRAISLELNDNWEYADRYKEVDLALAPERPAPDENLTAVWDELHFCCDSSLDVQIVLLRSQGYTLQEISTRLQKATSTIHSRLRKVESRYRERNG